MAYYRGDYYRGGRGDYYRGSGRGDPFWGLLAPLIVSGVKAIAGKFGGGGSVSGGVSGVQAAAQMSQLPARIPVIGQGGFTPSERPLMRMPPAERQAILQQHLRVNPQTGAVVSSRRHMNPANAKALRRSIRRVVGFGRLASRSKRAVGKAATALGCFKGRSARRAFPPRRRAS